jgi:hypothetical protein
MRIDQREALTIRCPYPEANDSCASSRTRRGLLWSFRLSAAGLCEPTARAAADTPPVNFKVAFLADQGPALSATAVLGLVRDEGAEAVLHLGDFDYIDNPQAWAAKIDAVLGPDFPYFAVAGNHDSVRFYGLDGYQQFIEGRMNRLGIPWQGDLGVQSTFTYAGIFFVLTAPDVFGSGNGFHDAYIRDRLAADQSIWRICGWHKNQRLMQAGGKSDETGWGVYEQARKGGAIIATGHEHSYSRTHLLSDMDNQVVVSSSSTLRLARDNPATGSDEGRSFAFVSGLGGQSIRDQEIDGPWWAAIYTSDQAANYGALFGVFNYLGDPTRAYFYFKDIDGYVADEFFVEAPGAETPTPPSSSTTTLPFGGIAAEEVRGGTSGGAATVQTATELAAVAGDTYLVAVSSKPNVAVLGVSGLGLTWTPVASQCSGRSQTGVSVWIGIGTPSQAGRVTATLKAAAQSAVIVVSRYSGVSASTPVGRVESANSNGIDGACTGGIDSASYSYGLSSVSAASVVYSTAAMRNKAHTPGAAFAERAEVMSGSGGSAASLAVSDTTIASTSDVTVDGSFGSATDWAALAVELNGLPPLECYRHADCRDGQFCNGLERCVAGSCEAGLPVGCDDGIACTSDACNESSDGCDHTPVDAVCDNGQFCDGTELCDANLGCREGSDPCPEQRCEEAAAACSPCLAETDCDDAIDCTSDACNESTGKCAHTPVDAACDNGQFCDGMELCNAGFGCQDGPEPCPQLCEEGTRTCVECLNTDDCDDGLFCNGVESCVAARCEPGLPVGCDDDVACTSDTCNESSDVCDHVPVDAVCDNGQFCDGSELCSVTFGCAAGLPVGCDDGVSCTSDACNESSDGCDHVPVDAVCDNGQFCDGTGLCDLGLGCHTGLDPCPGRPCEEASDACRGGQITFEEVGTGTSVNKNSVTTATAVTGVQNHLYLAAVSYKPNAAVAGVAGIGLTWTRVDAQCAGRGQTGIELWKAQGVPTGNGVITATFATVPQSAVIAVARYSGVSTSAPLGSSRSANTKGLDGTCTGGVDGASYSYGLPSVPAGSVVYSAAAMRNKTHTPGVTYAERAEAISGSGGSASSLALADKPVTSGGNLTVDGAFSGAVDWAAVAVALNP